MSVGTVVLYKDHEIDPVVTTHRLHMMQEVRVNLRRERMAATGRLVQTPAIDAAIEELERQLALHLPAGPGGIN